jgi:hypothetical protein
MKKVFWVLLIPIFIAWFALKDFGFVFKAGVPLSCALIIGFVFWNNFRNIKNIWYIIGAFVFSAAGDWFLSFKENNYAWFAIGIGLYFFAHAGYLGYTLINGRINKIFTAILLTAYLLFFHFLLYPAIDDRILLVSVFLYLLVSCVSLGAAAGIKLQPIEKWSFFAGITMILFSDTIIAFHEFTSFQEMNFLILPTYYAAHILVTFSILRRS